MRLLRTTTAFLAALGWLGDRLGWSNPLGKRADSLSPDGPWAVGLLALLALLALTATFLPRRGARKED